MPVNKIPTRMSGSEVLGCVELVTAAFGEATELMGRLSRNHKRRKGERDFQELLLFQVLEQGTRSVQKAYDDGFHSLGAVFKVGDDEARERLLCIAIEFNGEVVQPLHAACSSEKADAELTKLHEAAITARHDAVRSLGALRRRLDHLRPLSLSRFSPDSSICGDDAVPPPPPEKSGLRRMLSVNTNASSHRRVRSDGPLVQRPYSPQSPSINIPAPLSVNTAAPRTPDRSSIISTLTSHSRHQRSQSDVAAKRTSRNRLESLQHPDMPNYAAGAINSSRPRSAKHSRRDSMVSVARSAASSSTTSPRPSSTYTLQSIPYETTVPEHRAPPIPHIPAQHYTALPPITSSPIPVHHHAASSIHHAASSIHHAASSIHHAALSPITSPIAEVDDTASVTSHDYDAESVYSRADDDPGTPVTDAGSSSVSRHSGSEARTPATETSCSVRSGWFDDDDDDEVKAKGFLPMRQFSFRKRASTLETKGSEGRKWGWHRYSRSVTVEAGRPREEKSTVGRLSMATTGTMGFAC